MVSKEKQGRNEAVGAHQEPGTHTVFLWNPPINMKVGIILTPRNSGGRNYYQSTATGDN